MSSFSSCVYDQVILLVLLFFGGKGNRLPLPTRDRSNQTLPTRVAVTSLNLAKKEKVPERLLAREFFRVLSGLRVKPLVGFGEMLLD